jgi:uncharacterized protein
MRVVLDTNILVSALVSAAGTPSRLIDAWLDEAFTLCSHPLQLDEPRNVTRRPKLRALIRPSDAGRLVNQIRRLAEMPGRLPDVRRSLYPDDDFLLALCEAGKADWLATGDKTDLLALDGHGRTRIVTAARRAAELGLQA